MLATAPPRLHVLVHAAAVFEPGTVGTAGAGCWDHVLAVNLRAPMALTAALLPRLRAAGGTVVFVNSTAGLPGAAAPGLYAAGKAGLRAAADALRQEVNGDGVRVLSLFPGRTDTPMQREVLAAEGRAGATVPLMRAEDVARMVLAAISLPRSAEVTEIVMRPARHARAVAESAHAVP